VLARIQIAFGGCSKDEIINIAQFSKQDVNRDYTVFKSFQYSLDYEWDTSFVAARLSPDGKRFNHDYSSSYLGKIDKDFNITLRTEKERRDADYHPKRALVVFPLPNEVNGNIECIKGKPPKPDTFYFGTGCSYISQVKGADNYTLAATSKTVIQIIPVCILRKESDRRLVSKTSVDKQAANKSKFQQSFEVNLNNTCFHTNSDDKKFVLIAYTTNDMPMSLEFYGKTYYHCKDNMHTKDGSTYGTLSCEEKQIIKENEICTVPFERNGLSAEPILTGVTIVFAILCCAVNSLTLYLCCSEKQKKTASSGVQGSNPGLIYFY